MSENSFEETVIMSKNNLEETDKIRQNNFEEMGKMSENSVICVVVLFDIVIVISQMFQKIEQHGKSMLGN